MSTVISTPLLAILKDNTTILERDIDNLSSSESEDGASRSLLEYVFSSPYKEQSHQLELSTLSKIVADFAIALTSMTPTRKDYATAPYHESFNWQEIIDNFSWLRRLQQHNAFEQILDDDISFFVIVFRSRLSTTADRQCLGELDKAAHLEAVEAKGLLKYWFGTPDHNRRNLATCVWRARDDARLGGSGAGHAAAMIAARRMYDEWFVERLKLTVNTRLSTWKFDTWVE